MHLEMELPPVVKTMGLFFLIRHALEMETGHFDHVWHNLKLVKSAVA